MVQLTAGDQNWRWKSTVICARVVLIDIPRLNREILASYLEGSDELELVGEYPGDAVLSQVVEMTGANLVIAGDDIAPDLIRNVLEAHPRLRAVVVTRDGRHGTFYELRPRRTEFTELSFEKLLAAVRSADEAWTS